MRMMISMTQMRNRITTMTITATMIAVRGLGVVDSTAKQDKAKVNIIV